MKKEIATSPKRLAEKLRQVRLSLGYSQNQILVKLGFKERLFRSNISQYERGDREPPLLVLLAYAKLIDGSVDILIDDQNELPSSFISNEE